MRMRMALLSDIHGNPIALDAVLADIQDQGGVDAYWILGDIAAIGYAPIAAIERLVTLPDVQLIRGNTDRYVVTGERPLSVPTIAEAQADPHHLQLVVELERSFSWTQGAVTATGWLPWLASLPLEHRLTLPDGTRLLGVHAAPGCDDGPGVHPELDDAELRALLSGCDADLVCVGHTHQPLDRSADGVRVVNLGSVSNPPKQATDPRASYVLLEANGGDYRLWHRQVAYDYQAVMTAIERSQHPTSAYLMHFWQR
jgi:predicted phosphodiesterase